LKTGTSPPPWSWPTSLHRRRRAGRRPDRSWRLRRRPVWAGRL